MHEFSTVDGFLEITECMADMIKYLANEPSLGLFYVQQHTQNAVPNMIRLRNNIANKSHETTLHTEDSEDSIAMVRSMKECGFPIADEMIRDIKKSLLIMSTKQPKRGLIRKPRSDHQGEVRAGSWGPHGESSGYFSTVFNSAKKKAGNLKWPQLDSAASDASPSSFVQDVEADELPLSSRMITDEPREEAFDAGLSSSEDYEEFKADKEVKLEEWLEGNRNCEKEPGDT